MMCNKFWLTTLFLFAFAPATALSQERVQADVEVKSVLVTEMTGKLTCEVKVFNTHDDNAHDTKLVILLPVGVKIKPRRDGVPTLPLGCRVSARLHDGTQGVVTCNLGELAVNAADRTISFDTTLPPANVPKVFGAFAWSRTPDPNPTNNHWPKDVNH